MIFDVNNQIGKRRNRPEVTARDLISAMDKASVDHAVAFTFIENLDNEYVEKAIHQYPGRLVGLYTVNPWQEDSVKQFKYGLDHGFQGLRLDGLRQGFAMNNLDLLGPLMEVCQQAKVPVWGYGAAEVFTSPILFQELAEAFRDVSIIMGHMGFSYEATSAFEVSKRNENVYLDIAGNMFANIQRVVKTAPISQILLGTGTPDVGYFELEIEKVRQAVSTQEQRDLILGGNAARLFHS